MTIPTTGLDETKPAGGRYISLGDNDVREHKIQVREILEIDHTYPTSGQSVDAGKHKKISLLEQADIGTGATGKTFLGGQTVSGKPELVYTDEDDNDIQVTDNGFLKLASGKFANDTYLVAKDQAGTGTVDLIKATTSDGVMIPDGTLLATSAAPTVDAGVANKKYVDDSNAVSTGSSFPTSPATGDLFFHTTFLRMYTYTGSVWLLISPKSTGSTGGVVDLANSTGNLCSVTFTPMTEEVIISSQFAGGFWSNGSAPDYRLSLRRGGSDIGQYYEGELNDAPIQSSGCLVFRDTGLTPGTAYTWTLTNIATGSTCKYTGSTIVVQETN